MKNKVLVELIVPEIDKVYNIYIPINKKIGNIVNLLNKALFDINNGLYLIKANRGLYNKITGELYDPNRIIKETDIRNGTSLIIL